MMKYTILAAILAATTNAYADDCPCESLFTVLAPYRPAETAKCFAKYRAKKTSRQKRRYLEKCNTDEDIAPLIIADQFCRPDALAARLNSQARIDDMYETEVTRKDYYSICAGIIENHPWLSHWQLPIKEQTRCRNKWDGMRTTRVCETLWVAPPDNTDEVIRATLADILRDLRR